VNHGSEALWSIYGLLTEITAGDSPLARALRAVTGRHRSDGAIVLGKESRKSMHEHRRARGKQQAPKLVVLASGCLGLVYFPQHRERLALEEIDELYPKLIPGLRNQPGIGFLMVRSRTHGPLAIGARGTRHLDSGTVEGEDPLGGYGPNAARHLMRTDSFANVADIMINAAYDPEADEVPAFEELVGSHGGMGGTQSYPFVLYPKDWAHPAAQVVGAEEMHGWMRRWLFELGHSQFESPKKKEEVAGPAATPLAPRPAPVLAEAAARGQDPRST